MMAVAIERYITVCHPFFKITHNWGAYKWALHLFFIISIKFFGRYILPIFSFSLVYNVPKFFELKAEGVPGEHGLIDRDPLEVHWAPTAHFVSLPSSQYHIRKYSIKTYQYFIYYSTHLSLKVLVVALRLLFLVQITNDNNSIWRTKNVGKFVILSLSWVNLSWGAQSITCNVSRFCLWFRWGKWTCSQDFKVSWEKFKLS